MTEVTGVGVHVFVVLWVADDFAAAEVITGAAELVGCGGGDEELGDEKDEEGGE